MIECRKTAGSDKNSLERSVVFWFYKGSIRWRNNTLARTMRLGKCNEIYSFTFFPKKDYIRFERR